MSIFRRRFVGSDPSSLPDRSKRGAEIAGWLFLFGVSGAIYLAAAADNTWFWVPIFAGSLFMVVVLGILWDWIILRRPLLNARTIVLCGVLYWLLLDPLLMRSGIDDFHPPDVLRALLYAAIFIVTVWFGYFVTRPLGPVTRFFSRIPHRTNDDLVFFATVTIYLISILPLITATNSLSDLWRLLLAGYSSDVDVAWRRGMLGGGQDFLRSLARLLQLTIPFLGTYLIARRLAFWKKVVVGAMTLSLFLVIFFSGERRVLALIVLGPLGYAFFSTPGKTLKRWAPAFVLFLLALFWVMQAQVQFRSAGFYDFDATKVESNVLEMHRDNNFYWFTMAVDTMPSTYEYTRDWIFLQIFTHPIPRFLWPEKPYSTGFPFVQWEDIGASLSISVVGELYVSQGVFGIIVGGLIYGWMAKHWDSMRQFIREGAATGLIYSLGLTLLLIGVRSFGDIVLNWYIMAILIVVLRYVGVRRQARTRSVIWAVDENRTSVPT
jgi:oligosaccharide repeat unit polymerase